MHNNKEIIGCFADMHTHSENSHDSVCKIEEMYFAQRKKGCSIMAVCDHFDVDDANLQDIFAPIEKTRTQIEQLNKSSAEDSPILFGIEMGEMHHNPNVYEKVIGSFDFDVILGSVHAVDFPSLSMAYSQIDFSVLDRSLLYEYIEAYFREMLIMIDFADFDVLSHLNCPFRYINGKYRLGVNILEFERCVDKILEKIIQKGISLEVNTSSLDLLNDFMPSEDILQKYRKLGGDKITLGSDAHTAERASFGFDVAVKKLLSLGFERICFYKGRKINYIKLN